MTNKKYEAEINKLIPAAERAAKKRLEKAPRRIERRPGKGEGGFYYHDFFSQFFHKEINRLAHKAKLRGMI